MKIHIDFETKSFADLATLGAWRYSEHPRTDIICMAYKTELMDTPALWLPGQAVPTCFFHTDSEFIARNALFEYAMIVNVGIKKYDFPFSMRELNRWHCTAAMSRCVGLPGSLELCAKALAVPQQKMEEGKRLIREYSNPQKNRKTGELYFKELTGEDEQLMYEYCIADVEADSQCYNIMKNLPNIELERPAFLLDFKQNIEGLPIDTENLQVVLNTLDTYTERAEKEAEKIGVNPRSPKQLKEYFAKAGLNFDNFQESTVLKVLENPTTINKMKELLELRLFLGKVGVKEFGNLTLTDKMKELLELRLFLGKASVKKFKKFESLTSPDGQLRHWLLYYGAHTGRWSSKGVQLHNLAKSKLSTKSGKDVTKLLEQMAAGKTYEYSELIDTCKAVLPGMIKAPEGKFFLIGDFSAIEARGLAWLAGQDDLVNDFRRDIDVYIGMAATIYGISDKVVTKPQRQLGKQAILGCLAAGTNILTKKGYKYIEELQKEDFLWDGEKWVKNGTIVHTGAKNVIQIESLNIELTPGHWVLTPAGWQTAVEIDSNADTQHQILAQPTEESRLYQKNLKEVVNVVSLCAAYAELKKNAELINFGAVRTYFVQNAPSLLTGKKEATLTDTLILSLMQNLESVGLIVSTILKEDATTFMVKTTKGMAVAALPLNLHPLANFWNTLLHCAGLINGVSHWTELITMGTMKPETYELYLKQKTTKTVATYDIQNVGVFNCFQAGNAIVHNCGYGMGITRFLDTCQKYNMQVNESLANLAVTTYRQKYFKIKQFWRDLQDAFITAYHGRGQSKKIKVGKYIIVTGQKKYVKITLPAGRDLYYHKVQVDNEGISYYNYAQKTRVRLWGGLLAENVTQALCRDILLDCMLRAGTAELNPVLHVHDEVVCLVDNYTLSAGLIVFKDIMNTPPEWAPDFPLKTEPTISERYFKD